MRGAQEICNELFMAKAFSCMANVMDMQVSYDISRDYTEKLFPADMVDISEAAIKAKIRAWDSVALQVFG